MMLKFWIDDEDMHKDLGVHKYPSFDDSYSLSVVFGAMTILIGYLHLSASVPCNLTPPSPLPKKKAKTKKKTRFYFEAILEENPFFIFIHYISLKYFPLVFPDWNCRYFLERADSFPTNLTPATRVR